MVGMTFSPRGYNYNSLRLALVFVGELSEVTMSHNLALVLKNTFINLQQT
jgi:hypothetical protein